nr:Fe(3+)-hydroxamate ABC transporter permease FhuB [Agrobacterium sp. RS6]
MLCIPGALAALLSLYHIWLDIPLSAWWQALLAPDFEIPGQMIVHFITLPRIAASLLAGASLSLSGLIFQQVLRNPLAEPSTTGVSAGAALALKASALLVPSLALPPVPVACAGAAAAMCLTLALASRNLASPLRLILAGLVVGLFCGGINSVLALFFHEELRSVFLWNTGSLLNLGWDASAYVAPVLLICALLAVLMIRPLELLALEEHGGRSLGVPVVTVRLTGLLLAVVLASVTIAAVGVIGFVGMVAPTIARLAGARTFRQRVAATPLLGSILLWLADQITQINPLSDNELPTGVLTAIFGGALLLWMLPRLRGASLGDAGVSLARRNVTKAPCIAFALWAVLLVIIIWASLLSAQSLDGWFWQGVSDGNAAFEWRWPRVAASAIAGAMLAVAGAIIQRVTGNAMASPEILGISSGAGLGVALLFLFDPASGHALKVSAASGGAFLTLALSFALARNASASPERVLLTGVALATVSGAILSAITVRFDPRVASLLSWLAGSTYSVTIFDILALASVALGVTAILPLTLRWLEILPLGDVTARQIGVNVGASRLALLLIASLLTGTAVLTIGPLSFVGLMAPHLARMTGGRTILSQLIISAILGAIVMVSADWLGRNLLFPYEIPAGTLAALVGTPYFFWLMWHKSQ